MNNKAFCIHVTQFCIVLILWFTTIIPKFIHNIITFIMSTNLDTLAYSCLILFYSLLLLANPLKTIMSYGNQVLKLMDFFFINLISLWFLTFSRVFPKIIHWLKEIFLKVIFCFSKFSIHVNIWFQPGFLIKLNYSMHFFQN